MPDFWHNAGFHLVSRDERGYLTVTDQFLGAYMARPEMQPIPESCDAERTLHAALSEDPRQAVDEARIDAMNDTDARDNYRVMLAFRDRLVAAGTIEACYLSLFRAGSIGIPPLFIDQMAHIVARNILDGTEYPLRARAAEVLFREQTAMIEDGQVLLADSETVAMVAATGGFGDLGRLLIEAGTKPKQVELDVLLEETADIYWDRDEKHDTVLDITFTRPGLDALCRVLEAWVVHFLDVRVRIQPVQRIDDERWVWHTGLDADSSAILNDLYDGTEVDEARLGRILALFRLEFIDPGAMRADIAGRPVYMGLAMNDDNKVRFKAQNLLVNLPLARDI